MTGVSYVAQFFAALTAFAFGLLGGVPSLLFFRQSGKIERVLTDFFACAVLIILYLISLQLGSHGQLTFYTPLCFALGALLSLKILRILNSKIKPHGKSNQIGETNGCGKETDEKPSGGNVFNDTDRTLDESDDNEKHVSKGTISGIACLAENVKRFVRRPLRNRPRRQAFQAVPFSSRRNPRKG